MQLCVRWHHVPAKPLDAFVFPLERSGISNSSSYDLDALVEGSLDKADAPPPAHRWHTTVEEQLTKQKNCAADMHE